MKTSILSAAAFLASAAMATVQVNLYSDPNCNSFEDNRLSSNENDCFPINPIQASGARLVSCPTRHGCRCTLFAGTGCTGTQELLIFDDTQNSANCANINAHWQSVKCVDLPDSVGK